MDDKQALIARRQLGGIMGLLLVQFTLGVLLTTIINYQPSNHGSLQAVFLWLHIIVAVLLLLGAVFWLMSAVRWRSLQTSVAIGLTSIAGAMINGSIAATNGNSVAVFLMALFFIAAFASYGYSLGRTFPPRPQ